MILKFSITRFTQASWWIRKIFKLKLSNFLNRPNKVEILLFYISIVHNKLNKINNFKLIWKRHKNGIPIDNRNDLSLAKLFFVSFKIPTLSWNICLVLNTSNYLPKPSISVLYFCVCVLVGMFLHRLTYGLRICISFNI